MKTKNQIKEWLLKNCVDGNGDLNLSGLDLSDFKGDVLIINLKVGKDLYQSHHIVRRNLYQSYQNVEGKLYQYEQKVEGNLFQDHQEVKGNLIQNNQEVKGDLTQQNPKGEK